VDTKRANFGANAWLVIGVVLALAAPIHAAAILQIRVVEGEGAVYAVGSRATRGVTVQVTDETGKPVAGAAVSFRLPDAGSGGTFNGGLKADVVLTGPDGRASIWGMRWNTTPGPVEIRITAMKDQARAGTVTSVYLSDQVTAQEGGSGKFTASHSHKKLLLIGAAIAAAAVGGFALSGHSSGSPSTAGNAPLPPQVGTPTITISPHP